MFSVKSCREAKWSRMLSGVGWYRLWKLKIPSKVIFLWITVRGRLSTVDLLQRRGMVLPNVCLLWLQEAKNIYHLFIHYPYATKVWGRLIHEIELARFFPYDSLAFSLSWKISGVPKKGRILWELLYLATCWCIWLERNQRVCRTDFECL